MQAFAEAVVSGGIRLDGSATMDSLLATLAAIPGFSPDSARSFASRLGEWPAGGWRN